MMESSFTLTKQLLASGRHEEALNSLGPRDLFPADPELFALRGRCLLALNRFREALKDANECLRIDPEHNAGELIRMEALSRLGIQNGTRSKSLDDGDPHARFILAREAIERGDALTGVRHAEAVLDVVPGYIPAQCLVAYGKWLATSQPEHLDQLRQQFELDRFTFAGPLLAMAEERQGNSARAEEILRECVELAPYRLTFRAKLLDLLNRRGQYAEVLQLSATLPPEWTSDLRIKLAQAVALSSLYRTEEALEIVRPLFDEDPTNMATARVYVAILKQTKARWPAFKAISRCFFSTWRLYLQVDRSEKRRRRRYRKGS
jgi:tetratricopeptide (TPR) repeat protein